MSEIKSDPQKSVHSQQSKKSGKSTKPIEVPDFFLYTTLNQNQTKDLRKAATNRDERKIIAQIFGLNAIKKTPNDQINPVDQLILDYHYINFDYCVANQFSNEKISTFLAIGDFILQTMTKKQLQVEEGVKMLKDILSRHCLQRPPYSILIFTAEENQQIINFMLRTYFRHYSLYEYSFKPKVELVLMTIPRDVKKPTEQSVEDVKEASVIGSQAADGEAPPNGSNRDAENPSKLTGEQRPGSVMEEEENKVDSIDWDKVGKIYKPESAIEDILNKEMKRLNMAMHEQIDAQDVELEEKYNKGKKK